MHHVVDWWIPVENPKEVVSNKIEEKVEHVEKVEHIFIPGVPF